MYRYKNLLGSFVVAFASAASVLAQAQDSRGGNVEEVVVTGAAGTYTVDDSRSATNLDLSLRETPQSITVMTRERLDDQNLR
jgi:outer membrane receptor for ferric coprogen and ferric-rhodotorulic acid